MLVQVLRKIIRDQILGFQVLLQQEVAEEVLVLMLDKMVVQEAVVGEVIKVDWQSHLLKTWLQESPCPTCPL